MTRTVGPALDPGPPETAATPVVFSHPAADEPATAGGSAGEKARHVLFSAPGTVHGNGPQR